MTMPLEGIRILDLSIFQQGTYASAMLADMGADVVKIESTDNPDPGRTAPERLKTIIRYAVKRAPKAARPR